MQTQTEMQREVDEAVRTMRAGGIILYPTDTVWGLGCDATSAAAVERIYRLKRSGNKKSMLVLCASADMVVRYVNRSDYATPVDARCLVAEMAVDSLSPMCMTKTKMRWLA